jgi:hypothetical protein
MRSSSLLIQKLDVFIRKYYLNRLMRGVLFGGGVILASGLFLFLLEYFGNFGIAGRTLFFWALVLGIGFVVARFMLWPLLQWARISKGLTYEQASALVGEHFPEISDRLLNTLQLQQQLQGVDAQNSDLSLLQASIEERTEALQPFSFQHAVHLRDSLPHVWYALPPVLVIALIWSFRPEMVQEPAQRILAYRQDFVPAPPFAFQLITDPLEVPAAQSFNVVFEVIGSTVPDVVFLESNGNRFRMERTDERQFTHTFPVVRTSVDFRCSAAGVQSDLYTLEALPVPTLLSLEITTTAPNYTGRGTESWSDMGNLRVPEGTLVEWQVRCKDTQSVRLRLGDTSIDMDRQAASTFAFQKRFNDSSPYWLIPSNEQVGSADSLRYLVQVIPDLHPSIRVNESMDSLARSVRRFSGELRDDYGFSRLQLAYRWSTISERFEDELASAPNTLNTEEIRYIPLDKPSGTMDRFFFEWNLLDLGIVEGDGIEYWFEIWDNDGVNGAKMARSSTMTFQPPSQEDLREERDAASADIQSKMESAREEAVLLREEMEALTRQLREDDELDWKDERAIEEFMKRQEALQKQLDELERANEQKDDRANEFSPEEERMLEKQEQLQELMEQVMSDELKQLYEDMQRLMEEMDPDVLEEIQEQLESMEVDQESLEKELDRALEQFKQLEYEVKMDEALEELKELAEKQAELAEETRKESAPNDSLKAQQDSLNQAFEELKKELDALDKSNEELENPNPTMDRQEENESIQEKMEASSDQLGQDKNKKAAENQQDAADEMQQMADQMEAMMEQQQEEALEEDMDALRALLENIISLSFDEEGVMELVRRTNADDPMYITHGQTQRRLKDDARMVEDSLFALSLRITQLAPSVNREIGLINHHMDQALAVFGERKTDIINTNQQYVMTSFNNLALMLDDALQQMQQSMSESKPGSGNCEKPGGNGKPKPSPSAGDMKKMQKALGDKLEKMKESMGKGAKAGQSGKEQREMSKQLAQMAAQQAALRQMAERKSQELNEDGSGEGQQLGDIAKEMEELERDLVNRDVTLETLARQQELMVRLLEAESAERMRGEDDKRKSRTANQNLSEEPSQLIDYLNLKNNELELLRTVPLELDSYYRDRVNEYFNNLDVTTPELNPR